MENLKKTITRSCSRKLNLRLYGGGAFETADFFASYGEEVPADASEKALKRTSQMLYDLAQADVEEAVEETVKKLAQSRLKEAKKQRSEDYKNDPLNSL